MEAYLLKYSFLVCDLLNVDLAVAALKMVRLAAVKVRLQTLYILFFSLLNLAHSGDHQTAAGFFLAAESRMQAYAAENKCIQRMQKRQSCMETFNYRETRLRAMVDSVPTTL